MISVLYNYISALCISEIWRDNFKIIDTKLAKMINNLKNAKQ